MVRRPSEPVSRVWFISPAGATVVFLAAHLLLSSWSEAPQDQVMGLSTQTPSFPPKGRVSASIESANPRPVPVVRPAPTSEEGLLEQLETYGTVVFSSPTRSRRRSPSSDPAGP